LQEAAALALPRLTATFEMMGTPCYAAPEQLRGEPTSARSDLYSWGLVFLECLTGALATEGASGHDVMMRQLGPEPVPIPAWLRGQRLGRLLQVVTAKTVEKRDVIIPELLEALSTIASGEPVSRSGTSTHAAGTAAERRQLTLMSCRIALGATDERELDLDEQDDLLHALEATVRDLVHGAGGHLTSVLGERLLVVFGHPQAREDDARRAVRAALHIAAEMQRTSDRLENERAVRARAHIGVHTGLVIVRELRGVGERTLSHLLGPTPQVAARLEERAGPSEVLVSADTHRLLRGVLRAEPAGTLRLSEHSADMPIFLVTAAQQRFAIESVHGLPEPPLVARRLERAHLLDGWAQARAGSPVVTLLTGEPGIGKSRLLRELRREVPVPDWLECRCVIENQSSPLRPFAELLAALPEPLETLLERMGFDLAQTMPLFGHLLERSVDDRFPPLAVTPEREKELMLTALVSLAIRVAQERPVVLAVEDLHWADPTTIELVGLLIEEIRGARMARGERPVRLLLALSARPEFDPPWSTHDLDIIQPARLGRDDVEALVAAVVASRQVLDPRVVDLVAERSDGVPLFVEEVTHVLAEAGQLTAPAEPLPRDTPEFEVPASLRDLLAARLDPLSPSARETAQIAAALGREFRYEFLRAVLAKDDAPLRVDLRELLDAGLAHARRAARVESYVFKHTLVRDAAYESMTRPTRRRVHRLVAHALRERFPEVAQTQPEMLAQHFERGDEPETAVECWLRAGDRSMRRAAYTEAIAQLERGLAVLRGQSPSPARSRLELEVLVALGTVLFSSRGYGVPEVEDTFARASMLCQELGQDLSLKVLNGLVSVHITRSDFEATALLIPRFRELSGRDDVVLALAGHATIGCEAFWRGDFTLARQHSARAVELYDTEDFQRFAREYGYDGGLFSFAFLMTSLWQLGYADSAEEVRRKMMTIAEAAPDPYSILLALGFDIPLLIDRGEAEAATTAIDRLTLQATEQKLYFWLAVAMCGRGGVLLLGGDAEGAVPVLRQGLDLLRSLGVMSSYSYYLNYLVGAHLEAGQLDDARAVVDEGLELCTALLARFHRPELLRLRGELLLRQGDAERAEASIRDAMRAACAQEGKAFELRAATSLARLLGASDRRGEARALLGGVYGWFTEGLETRDLRVARELLATLR
jgi:class 3 adenylate cyclase/tetratricopeptide (TPR) repeat protein